MNIRSISRCSAAFTLIEMLVVIGIIGIIIALLLPALHRANMQSQQVVCMSNMRQVGIDMLTYADYNNGYLFPPDKGWPNDGSNPQTIAGTNPPQYDVWPYYVFDPHVWDPKIMYCPTDLDPLAGHSYAANAVLLAFSMPTRANANAPTDIRYSTTLPPGCSTDGVIVLLEKLSSVDNYYMSPPPEYDIRVDIYRHGLSVGSNFLMLDMHVETDVFSDAQAQAAMDPWGAATTQPTTVPAGS
jgi:prepilin-type N-terminal cleavage/methylation domain-containing protein